MTHSRVLCPAGAEAAQTPAPFQPRAADAVGMWPQWQGQHHGPGSGEQNLQQPQPSQPEVFPVRWSFLTSRCGGIR